MVYTFRSDIIIVSVMVSDAYTITDTDPIPTNIANTDLSIWYRCIPNGIGDRLTIGTALVSVSSLWSFSGQF